jgi:hypothetical protein
MTVLSALELRPKVRGCGLLAGVEAVALLGERG